MMCFGCSRCCLNCSSTCVKCGMKWEGIKQTDVEANRIDERNDIEENVRNEITEKGEKMPKNINSNLKTLASMAEPMVEPVKNIGGALGKGGLKLADSLLVNK